jgi:methylated-DNA-[protein]-cysteine S-methyltransferase
MYFKTTKSPLGPITLFAEVDNVISLEFGTVRENKSSPLIKEAISQLKAYFKGQLKHFNLPLNAPGTDFQKTVWGLVIKIPYGSTRSYSQLSQDLSSSPRAVGGACGKNPIPIKLVVLVVAVVFKLKPHYYTLRGSLWILEQQK